MCEQISFQDLVDELCTLHAENGQVVVGIDGLGGSGKSMFADALASTGGSNFVVVRMDDFFRPSHERSERSCGEIGSSFDWVRMKSQVIEPLRRGIDAQYQRYDWIEDKLTDWNVVHHGTIAVIEGVYSTRSEIANLYDRVIWIECRRSIRLQRGLERDGQQAGMRWKNEWMPAEDQYVEVQMPSRRAHFTVKGDPEFAPRQGYFVGMKLNVGHHDQNHPQ